MIEPNDVILFQGDSITDCGRNRDVSQSNNGSGLGHGYALITAAMLQQRFIGQDLRIFNRGISGNKVTDLADRWQTDCLDLKPDVLSVLIGVNDTWHGTAKGQPENSPSLEKYETVYRQILTDARAANPELKLVLCEPFVTEAGAVLELKFHPEIDERMKIVRKLADEFGAVFVPFQSLFAEAAAASSPAALAQDGVHPTLAGHMKMAQWWMDAVVGE